MTARKTRRKKAEPASQGLTPQETAAADPPPEVAALEAAVAAAGGAVLAHYREPWGGRWLTLAALPVAKVEPTPFQRDLSEAHAKRLEDVIGRLGTFLDPIVAVAAPEGDGFWTPNGLHRLSALKRLGARTVTALLSPDPGLAYRILALNTEKAHNLKERSLEVVRMARGLAEADPDASESSYELELEEAHLITLGFAYEQRPRFAGGAYAPALKPSDAFLDAPLSETLPLRQARAERLLAIDDRVSEIIAELKEKGFDSPYLRNFVSARIRPFRRRGQAPPAPEALLDHMEEKAAKFDVGRIRADQVARTAGGGD
jgi:ParB family chromosome partitioning protein